MNRVILMGRLTRDPEVRYSQGDRSMAIARYTLAVDRRGRKSQEGDQGQNADFIIAEDANGKIHTIRTAEWAAEEWKKKCHAGKNDE